MLRYAYLTAFSLLGYYYAAGPALDPIRHKIQHPTDPPHLFGVTQYDSSAATRHLWVIREPPDLRSIAVQIGREIVFLPRDRDDGTFYDRFAARRDGPEFDERLTGAEFVWPSEPLHLDDKALF